MSITKFVILFLLLIKYLIHYIGLLMVSIIIFLYRIQIQKKKIYLMHRIIIFIP